MNQIIKITAVDPVAAFVTEAATRLRELGYDFGAVSLTCRAWNREATTWVFRPTIWHKANLPDITASTQAECLTLARAWLAGLKSETEMLAAVLGIAAE